MAHLNVAEKRIEATIAYIGVQDALTRELSPTDAMLGECPVHVRVVAQPAATAEPLADADAVVVEDPVAAGDVRAALGLCATPVIVSEGAETFQRVVGVVMQSITAEPTETDRASAFPQKRADGHPLLSALRRVLEATAEEQARAMAERLERKIDDRLVLLERRVDALGTQLGSTNEELLKGARHACTREDLATATADIRTEIMHAVADKLDELLVKLDAMRATEPRVGQTLARIDVAVRDLAKGTVAEAVAEQERSEQVLTLLNEMIEELRKPKKGFFG